MSKNPSDWAFVSRAECQTIVDYLPFIQFKPQQEQSEFFRVVAILCRQRNLRSMLCVS